MVGWRRYSSIYYSAQRLHENFIERKLVHYSCKQVFKGDFLQSYLLKMVMRMRTVGAAVVATLWLQYYVSFLGVCAQLTVDPPSPEPSLPWLDDPIAPLPSPSAPESTSAPEHDMPAQSVPLEHLTFDYSLGDHGPAHWGDLSPDWLLCKTGTAQSPLAITPDIMISDPSLGDLDATYSSRPVAATISNNGHGIQVELLPSTGVLKIYNVTYRPKEFHFHTPSEHQIFNYRFPLEVHLVHLSEDNRKAVISILFVYGGDSPFLAQFFDKLPSFTNLGVKTNIGPIKLLPLQHNYGRYRGSLTVPPCSEHVMWTVMLWDWPTVSNSQLQQLKHAMRTDNARPFLFPSHGRRFHINHTPNWVMEQLKLGELV